MYVFFTYIRPTCFVIVTVLNKIYIGQHIVILRSICHSNNMLNNANVKYLTNLDA